MRRIQNLVSLLLLFIGANGYSQTAIYNAIDSTKMATCGTSASFVWAEQSEYLRSISTPSLSAFVPLSSFPSAQVEHCGAFNIYYEDYLYTTAAGFADPTLGLQRRNTFCAVLNYIQSVINIPSGVTLDIYVLQSRTSPLNPAPAGITWLARGGPYYAPGGFGTTPGFYGGDLSDHIISGVDPDPNNYDAHIEVNFEPPCTAR